MKSLSATRVIVFGGLLGIVAGVGLSFWRQGQVEAELERLAAATEALPTDDLPGAPLADPEAGKVTLPAVDGLPPYPDAYVRPVAQSDALDVAWFATKDGLEDVLAFYERELREKGKIVVAHRYGPYAAYVGYQDLSSHKLHLISVLRQRDETVVFPSQSEPEKLARRDAPVPGGLPAVAGSEGGVQLEIGEGPGRRRVWLTTFPERDVATVTRAWRDELTKGGWALEQGQGEHEGTTRIDATRGGVSARITFQRAAASAVAVYVTVSGA